MKLKRETAPGPSWHTRMMGVVLALLCGVMGGGDAYSLPANEGTIYKGRQLIHVLAEFQASGLDLIFSSAVVSDELEVSIEPAGTKLRVILDEILLPLGLKAEQGPGGSILILPATPEQEGEGERTPVRRTRPNFVTQVVVIPNQYSLIQQEQAARHSVLTDEAILAPTIGGDITRIIEMLPGVSANDNTAAFNVRGSLAKDVSLVLDGMELYDPFHLQSFHSPFSLVDSNVVDRIDFFGGGFTADLGDRHGGFVDISTITPRGPTWGELEIGTLNSRFSYQAPLVSGAGSWLISLRGWYPERVLDATELGAGEKIDPRFGDVYAKASFTLSPRHQLSAHGLFAIDRLRFDEVGEEVNESIDADTTNGYLWLRALSTWTDTLHTETMLSGGRINRRRNGVSSVDGPVIVKDDREVNFFGFKQGTNWQVADDHLIKAGVDVRWLEADYEYSLTVEDERGVAEPIRLDPEGYSLGVYLAHRARLSPKFTTEFGLRWDRQIYTDDNQLSPRFNAVWRPAERSEFRLALGRFNQSQRIHELQVEDGETEFRQAEVSKQADLSFEHRFERGLNLRVDAYHRSISDIRPRYENLLEPLELFPETVEDRVRVAPTEARLRGVEFLLRSDTAKPFFWWVSYTLSSAEDHILGVGDPLAGNRIIGRDVPRSWDQTHAGKFLVGYKQAEQWSVSLSGSMHTGWPSTMMVDEDTFGERNAASFPTYTRFDFKGRRSFRMPRGRLWLTLEILNLTDRENACCVDEFMFETLGDGSVRVTRQLDYWLGITPSFSALWEF